jgi:hypothetical protein
LEAEAPRAPRAEGMERMLDDRGHTFGRVRIAFARSGIAIGFPRDPMLHVSWWALVAVVLVVRVVRRLRR